MGQVKRTRVLIVVEEDDGSGDLVEVAVVPCGYVTSSTSSEFLPSLAWIVGDKAKAAVVAAIERAARKYGIAQAYSANVSRDCAGAQHAEL